MRQYFKPALWGTVFLIASIFGQASAAKTQGCVMDSWGRFLAPEPQAATLVEEIKAENGVILAFKFDALAGEYAKVFIFLLDGETCFRRAVSFGSYAMTNTFAVESGDAGPDGRLYHGDLYEPESHSTLGLYDARPTYEEARKIALGILK